jgi:hypothetical protein
MSSLCQGLFKNQLDLSKLFGLAVGKHATGVFLVLWLLSYINWSLQRTIKSGGSWQAFGR